MDEAFMLRALAEAALAFDEKEVPVGAIIVQNERIIASAHNQTEQLNDPTAHAEMIAITQAAESTGSWRLSDCILYVTLEPCAMCAGAIVQARIPRVVYGTADPKGGAVHSLFRLLDDERLNHQSEVTHGIHATEAGDLLSRFFQQRRAEKRKR